MTKSKPDKTDGQIRMKGADFKRWRKALGYNQKEAAEALGLKRRVVQYYEKGERDGKSVEIPKYIRLACYALTAGQADYSGPTAAEADKKKPKTDKKPAPAAEPAEPSPLRSRAAAKAAPVVRLRTKPPH